LSQLEFAFQGLNTTARVEVKSF